MYHKCMVAIQAMLDVMLLIKDINNFVYLVGICASKRYDFVVLRHLVQKVLSVRPKDMDL